MVVAVPRDNAALRDSDVLVPAAGLRYHVTGDADTVMSSLVIPDVVPDAAGNVLVNNENIQC